jgi:hypothetical protein
MDTGTLFLSATLPDKQVAELAKGIADAPLTRTAETALRGGSLGPA